jgi:hypothetical protein
VLKNGNVWIAEGRPQTARGGSRGLTARWRLLAVDRVFLTAPIVPGLNLTPAKENQLGGTPLENSGAFCAQAAA